MDIVERLRAWDGGFFELNKEAADEIERLQNFVDFVNVWCWRESKTLTDFERLDVIKHHPAAQGRLKELNGPTTDRS